MSNLPKISFVAPCYNGEAYIQRFLTSILDQTYPNIELIVINDGSSDRTEEIISGNIPVFEKKGYTLILLSQENQGIGAALNNALKCVTGEYLTWFGSDDFAVPEYSEKLVGFLEENSEFAVVRNDGWIVHEGNFKNILGKMADSNLDKDNPDLFENAILERNFQFGYSVVRMKEFEIVNSQRDIYPSRHGQNWQLLLPVFYRYKAAFYHEPLYYVISNEDSVSAAPRKTYKKLIAQNDEYELILNETLGRMDIPDKDKYLNMVKVKYIKKRMCAAIDFKMYNDAIYEYENLKHIGRVTIQDKWRYVRARYSNIDSLANKIKDIIKNGGQN